jgi:hypothetical protein
MGGSKPRPDELPDPHQWRGPRLQPADCYPRLLHDSAHPRGGCVLQQLGGDSSGAGACDPYLRQHARWTEGVPTCPQGDCSQCWAVAPGCVPLPSSGQQLWLQRDPAHHSLLLPCCAARPSLTSMCRMMMTCLPTLCWVSIAVVQHLHSEDTGLPHLLAGIHTN